MKPLILITAIICFCSCRSNQKKAEARIKSYLDSSLNDPSGYQPIKFDTLQVVYKIYTSTKDGEALLEKAQFYNDKTEADLDLISKNILAISNGEKSFNQYEKDRDSLKKVYDIDGKEGTLLYNLFIKNKQNFKSTEIDHYTISHLYRAKNQYGALQLRWSKFEIYNLDKGYVSIDTTIYNPE